MPLRETSSPSDETNGGLINSPDIESTSDTPQRAIKDMPQARSIVKSLIAANRDRQIVNNRILAKYNAERPYNQQALKEQGLGWRSNFTTKPLPQMIEKVAPRFVEAVQGAKFLTNASLPADVINSSEKTEKFREEITNTIRARKGWLTFVEDVALDNALFGYTSLAWLDPFTVMPSHFSQDEFFFPDGAKQEAEKQQIALYLETYLPHELYGYIKDKQQASEAGWNIQGCIDAINKAAPQSVGAVLSGSVGVDSWYQNAVRELTVGSSYMAGANVIYVYSLFVREVTGKVSHYRFVGDREGTEDKTQEIFTKEDCYDNMSDAIGLTTFQKGNKRLHGSKGIGREIYEMAGMIDRMRNEVVDRGILSGKTFVQGDVKRIHSFRMSVVGNMLIVPDNWKFLEVKLDGNIDQFLKLDAYFAMIVDQLIGAVTPRTFQGDRVTKAEVDLFAEREEEGRDARISRFLSQFIDIVTSIQKRLCDKDTLDDDAKAMQERLLKVMTRAEIDQLAKQPVAMTVSDWTPTERQIVSQLCAEKRGNPLYNARQLEVEDLNARVGTEFAKKVLLPEADPTEKSEQVRLQLLEMDSLAKGQAIPVSPRDNHLIHLEILMPAAEGLAQEILAGNADTNAFKVVMAHLTEHYNYAVQGGAPKDKLKPVEELVKKSGDVIAKMEEMDQQAQELQAGPAPEGGEPGAAPPTEAAPV